MRQPKFSFPPCTACGGEQFVPFAIRSDGVQVVQCRTCGLGVASGVSTKAKGAGISDDREWIERLLTLVGGSNYRIHEQSASDTGAARTLASIGTSAVLASGAGLDAADYTLDCAEQVVDQAHPVAKRAVVSEDSAELVVSVAALEHAEDFGVAFGRLVNSILPDGVAFLIVPTLPVLNEKRPAPLQRFYPTEACLERIAAEHKYQLIHVKLSAEKYAPVCVGFLTANAGFIPRLQGVLDKLVASNADDLSREEQLARLHFNAIYLRHATNEFLHDLARVNRADMSNDLLKRAARLWASDLHLLQDNATQIESLKARCDEQFDRALRWEQSWRKKSEQLEAQTGRLVAKLDVVVRDGKLNVAQANQAVIYEMERSALLEARANGAELRAIQAEQRLLSFYGEYEAMRNSSFWRVTAPFRKFLVQHPQAARRARQFARIMWWSAKFKLRANLREVKRRRLAFMEEQAAAARRTATPDRPAVTLLPVENFNPELQSDVRGLAWPHERPLVSVVIPCFNYGHLVREAIASVEAQTFQDVEIIVVEGGSTSAQSRQYFEPLIMGASVRVRVLLQGKAQRAGANRNFGISHARGKYVCCLDADDRLAPTYLEKAVFLLENYGYDVVSPGMKYFGERNDVFAPLEQPDLSSLLKANSILTCSVYPRALWKEAGGFRDSDPNYGHIHEDWLFWARLAALGARFFNFREPLLFYRTHGETLSKSSSVIDNETQSRYVAEFNADVLSADALARSRQRSSQDRRVPRPLENVLHAVQTDDQRPTIMLTVPCLILGGAERLLSKIVGHLAQHGWRIIIVSTVPVDAVHGDTTEWFQAHTSEIYHLPRFLPQDRWKDFVDYLFLSRRVSVLWNAGSIFFYDYLPALTQRFPDLKVVDLLFNTVGHTANNRRYSNVIDMHLVENEEVRQWLINAGESPERIELIESGVDLDAFRPAAKDGAFLRGLGVPEGVVLIGFSGRWAEEKDPLAVVEIAKRMPPDLPIAFIMLGSGALENAVRAAVQQAGLSPERFIIVGPVDDVKPYMAACDVLLVPSRLDGRPNVVMEALASGTAVVASRVGGLPEMVEEGVTGYLCEQGDYAAFANRVHELAINPRLLGELKRKARSYAEQRLDMNVMLRAYELAFDALLADGQHRLGTPSASDREG